MRIDRFVSFPIAGTVALAALWVTAVLAQAGGAQKPPGAPQPPSAAQPPVAAEPAGMATVVGDETCLTCHETQKQGYSNTMHGRRDHPRSPAAKQGCETCHGAGSTHADDPEMPGLIRSFPKLPPREANATCLTCHARGTHALWEGSVHDAKNLSCVTCHSVHAFKSEKAQLKTVREMDTCATCHRDKVAKIDRSGHMPVREGKMAVLDLPQPARLDQRQAAAQGGLGCGDVHLVPRRQARPVPVGTRADARRLHDLPRPARLVERAHAGHQAADPLPAVPRRDASSQHHL